MYETFDPDTARRVRAYLRMTQPAQQQFQTIKGHFALVEGGDMLAGHDLGTILQTMLQQPANYGPEPIELLATALDVPARDLNALVTLAMCFSREGAAQLIDLARSHGHVLTPRHFGALGQAGLYRAIVALAIRVADEGWSPEQITRYVRGQERKARKQQIAAVQMRKTTSTRVEKLTGDKNE